MRIKTGKTTKTKGLLVKINGKLDRKLTLLRDEFDINISELVRNYLNDFADNKLNKLIEV